MKKLLVAVVALAFATSAMAQILPVGQTAAKTDVGGISATVGAGVALGDSDKAVQVTTIGARCSYGVIDNLLLIGDVGMNMWEAGPFDGNEVGIGIAAQYTIPVELPVDLAVRVGYGTWDIGEMSDAGAIRAMVLASAKIEAVDGLAVYGGVGIVYPLMDEADMIIQGDVGVTYGLGAVVKNLSLFGELSFATEDVGLGLGLGATYAF